MAGPNESEKQRLVAVYAAMADEELTSLAADAADLTDEAREVLAAQLAARGLVADASPPAETHELENRPLVIVGRFRDLPTALLAKGSLESAGIECFLMNENMVRLDWFISNLLGGITLQVGPEDVEAATEILGAPPEDFQPDSGGPFNQPECPNCHSREVNSPGMNTGASAAILWATAMPVPIPQRDWKCEDCGHRWREDARTAQA
jgi:hypothetical protein